MVINTEPNDERISDDNCNDEKILDESDSDAITEDTIPDPHAEMIAKIKPGLYGWGRFTPKWLQVFNKPQWLLAIFAFTGFTSTLAGALMPAITETLERRFNINSTKAGIMNISYDIASLLLVFLVCHYGERGHKGRWIGIGALIFGTGSFIMIIPHYVDVDYNPAFAAIHNYTCPTNFPVELCIPGQSVSTSYSYYILMAGQAIRGVGGICLGTLMFSYLDENIEQRQTPWYIAILSITGLIAMALGFFSAGQFLTIYGDFDRVPKEKWPLPTDPKFFGCWWLGYYIGGITAFMIALPILGFPKELPSKVEARKKDLNQTHNNDDEGRVSHNTGFGDNWREIPKNIVQLIKNPVFTCFTLRNTLEVCFGSGWAVFMPKYLQNIYGMDIGFSAMVSGAISLGPIFFGTLFGGWIIKRFNWKVRGVLTFGFLATVVGSFCCLGVLFGCPTMPVTGGNIDYSGNKMQKGQANLTDQCNDNCSCTTIDYVPVCFEEAGIMYYSPCFAGCKNQITIGSYTDCECVKNYYPYINATVTAGECKVTSFCIKQRNWMIAFWVVTCFCYGISGMPMLQSFLRSVPFEQRTLALGLGAIPLRLLGTIPGPILMGMVFDYSCILWKTYCAEKQACLKYDNDMIIQSLLIIGLVLRISSGALLLLSILLYRPPKKDSVKTEYAGSSAQSGDKGCTSEDTEYEGSYFDIIIEILRKRIRRN